jgi:putative resolvase
MENKRFVSRKQVLETLGIHYQTLRNMANRKDIEYIKIGRKNMYNLDEFLKLKGIKTSIISKRICYCRVSSNKQKDDLTRQIKYMRERYPYHEIISDVGSGLNYNRKGLNKILDIAIKGELKELVIAYKDRLTRFGYEMIENIIKKYSDGMIRILNKREEETPIEEISKDIVAIMNVYTAKINGLRKYKSKKK